MPPDLIALYIGPDQMMPLTSFFAVLLSFLLIFWNRVVSIFRKLLGIFKRSGDSVSAVDPAPSREDEPPKQA